MPAFPASTTELEGRAVDEYEGYNPFNFLANMIGPMVSMTVGQIVQGRLSHGSRMS